MSDETTTLITDETPMIIYLTKGQLDNLLTAMSAPVTLNGPEIIRRGNLLKTLTQAVEVKTYNAAIINRFIIDSKAITDQAVQETRLEQERLEAERQASLAPEKPKVANTPDTFKPFHLRHPELVPEPVVEPEKDKGKKRSHKKKISW